MQKYYLEKYGFEAETGKGFAAGVRKQFRQNPLYTSSGDADQSSFLVFKLLVREF